MSVPIITMIGEAQFASLLEIMRRFDAWGIAMLLHHITERREFVRKFVENGSGGDKISESNLNEFFLPTVMQAQFHAKEYSLRSTFDRVWDNGPFMMSVKIAHITWQQMGEELRVLRECIEADLEKHLFAFILPSKFEVMLTTANPPWEEIVTQFPDAKMDVMHAGECYAFELNTACVYHLMRITEYGLRKIAKDVGVKLTDKGKPMPVEYATWDKVINGINTKIAATRSLPHGAKKSKRLQFYSNTAENCSYLRDLWRNDVAHARKDYNDGEAVGVFNRVKDFMHLLATQKP